MAWTLFIEPGLLVRRAVTIKDWPGKPLKIVFISDLHAGAPHINREYIANVADKIAGENPDLLLLGGDLVINEVVGGKVIPFDEVAALFKDLNPPLGKFAVRGNHDWWNNAFEIRDCLTKNGFVVLENESRRVGGLVLVGIGDDYTKHADLRKSLSGIGSDGLPVITFMHDPGALNDLPNDAPKIFLSIAGHMHGGQINMPFYGAIITPGRAPRKWAAGLTELPNGKLFVSKGIGTSSLPIRFNAAPEYVVISLAPPL